MTPEQDEIDWATVTEGDTICWHSRHTGPKWGKVRYVTDTHVKVFGTGPYSHRYSVPRERVTQHFKGSDEFDQRRYR